MASLHLGVMLHVNMKSILIQFYAEPSETFSFIENVSGELGLFVFLMKQSPFKVESLSLQKNMANTSLLNEMGPSARIILSDKAVFSGVNSLGAFLDANPEVIVMDVGQMTDHGLHESCLSFKGDKSDSISLANKVAAKLKKFTKAGATAVDPKTGAEARLRSHRYTKGAKSLFEQGVKILPVAGTSLIKL
jgi:hypothetical protein